MTILSVEIARTKSKIALFDHEKDSSGSVIITPGFEPIIKTFDTQYEVSALQNMIKVFLRENYDDRQEDIYGACFSIAAPVTKGTATLSDGHRSVTFTEQDFRQTLPYPNLPLAFLNDMEAIGYGIFFGDNESMLQEIHKSESSPNRKDSRALMLVSDGLGAANWTCRDEKKENLEPEPSEWGHGDLAVRAEDEWKLLAYLKARKFKNSQDDSPVSREYALSKRGLQRIYRFLENPPKSDRKNLDLGVEVIDDKDLSLEPEVIIEKALQGDSLCGKALDLFMTIWGAETGNLALTFKSQGGVYIVTDLPIPLAKFTEGTFMRAFLNKEPEEMGFKKFLDKIQIKFLQQQDIFIWSAARSAINKGFVTKGKFAIMRANQ